MPWTPSPLIARAKRQHLPQRTRTKRPVMISAIARRLRMSSWKSTTILAIKFHRKNSPLRRRPRLRTRRKLPSKPPPNRQVPLQLRVLPQLREQLRPRVRRVLSPPSLKSRCAAASRLPRRRRAWSASSHCLPEGDLRRSRQAYPTQGRYRPRHLGAAAPDGGSVQVL